MTQSIAHTECFMPVSLPDEWCWNQQGKANKAEVNYIARKPQAKPVLNPPRGAMYVPDGAATPPPPLSLLPCNQLKRTLDRWINEKLYDLSSQSLDAKTT